MKYGLVTVCVVLIVESGAAGRSWMNRSLTARQRAENLVAEMSLEEKADELQIQFISDAVSYAYLTNRFSSGRTVGAIMKISGARQAHALQSIAMSRSRLQIPFVFHEDVTHGFRTILPVGLGSACTWNERLIEECEAMSAREAAASGFHLTYAPMCDISDDPRWGRICETSGEDPYLSARLCAARVRGFHRHLASCAKHFVAYGALRAGRDYYPADCSERELEETYLAPYRAAIAEGVDAVMCAYTPFDAVNCTFSSYLNRFVLREKLGFKGELLTDWETILSGKRYGVSAGPQESVMKAIQAGIDADMVSYLYADILPCLVRDGRVSEKLVDEACIRCLELKFKLGLFDRPFDIGCDEQKERATLFTEENRKLARQMVGESVVLLENKDGLLPLGVDRKVAVCGPLSDAVHDQLGDWICFGRTNETVTILAGMRNAWGKNLVEWKDADVVIYCAGEKVSWGGEHHSRMNPCVPAGQIDEIKKIKARGKQIVVVVLSARPLVLTDLKTVADAILFAFFPGTEGGSGIADIISGAVNPSGRLVQTFPAHVGQIPISYRERRPWMHNDWVDGPNEPLYPFGYGLSYTKCACAPPTYVSGGVRTTVTNVGNRDGQVVVQMYVRHEYSPVVQRERELKGFVKLCLKRGESRQVEFPLSDRELAILDEAHRWRKSLGPVTVSVGFDSSTTNSLCIRLNEKLER